jgi:hypothetical protein
MGTIIQGVLLTLVILAIHFIVVDSVLLVQCSFYTGFTWKRKVLLP